MAQVIINGFKLNAYITCGAKQVVTKNDAVKTINLIYFICTMQAQRDEEGFKKAFQTHAIEGYGFINQNGEIEAAKWSADNKKFDALGVEFYHLQNKMVEALS